MFVKEIIYDLNNIFIENNTFDINIKMYIFDENSLHDVIKTIKKYTHLMKIIGVIRSGCVKDMCGILCYRYAIMI